MGSDAYGEYMGENKIKLSSRYLTLLTYLIQPFVKSIICKSKFLQSFIYQKKKSHIIPNGVLMEKINEKKDYRKEIGLSPLKRYVLFLGDKKNIRKNFKVVELACKLINSGDVLLLSPYPTSGEMVLKYLSSVDVLVSSSFMEGSSNVIKEAMAYNCPVVATDVGDVRWLFGKEPGYFITGFNPEDVANKIKLALIFTEKYGRTNGRKRIIDLGLDDETIANKIVDLYNNVIQ
jgi:glycosyltransferase involved in cell wall biosynthesis